MRVVLKRTWITPLGGRLKKGVRDIPTNWRERLPSDAREVAADYVEPIITDPFVPKTFSELSELNRMDEARATHEAEDATRRDVQLEVEQEAADKIAVEAAAEKGTLPQFSSVEEEKVTKRRKVDIKATRLASLAKARAVKKAKQEKKHA
ncbi:MAG: hypothetical protein V3V96_15355 [Acidiferrobacterales bacterium]